MPGIIPLPPRNFVYKKLSRVGEIDWGGNMFRACTAFIAYTPKWEDFVWLNTRLGQPFMFYANYTCGLGEDGEVDPGNLEFITDPLAHF